MQLSEKRDRETRAWLEKASADIKSAELLFKAKDPQQYHQVLFHSQQAVEKSLKAFLIWHQVSFRWTHDIGEIGQQCSKIDSSLDLLLENVEYLSDHAWEYRYPGEDQDPTRKEAALGLKNAKYVYAQILERLPKDQFGTSSRRSHKPKRS